jgi:hypothetical protein
MTRIEVEPVDRARVTDLLIPDQGPVTRLSAPKALADSAPRVPARFAAEGVPDGLIAEHGFSALVRVEKNGLERSLLFDTGVSPTGMVENMRRLGLSLRDVEVRPDVRDHHYPDRPRLRRTLRRPHPPGSLHRLEGGPPARRPLSRHIRPEHGRDHDRALNDDRPPREKEADMLRAELDEVTPVLSGSLRFARFGSTIGSTV